MATKIEGRIMQSSPTITFRNIDPSPAIEAHVQQRTADLAKFHAGIVSCDVVIEAAEKRQVRGREFAVHLKVAVPGPDIEVVRRVGRSTAGEDVNVAIHEAFDAARRILVERKRKLAGR